LGVQIRNFGWTKGNIASFVVGLLSLLLAITLVLREKIRGRALWRRYREVRYRAVDEWTWPQTLTIAWEPPGRWHRVHGDGKATSNGIYHLETMMTSRHIRRPSNGSVA
jgi:hypothetical protein